MSNVTTVQVFRCGWQSTVSGVITVATPVLISVANHRYGGGSTWIDALAVILATLAFFGMAARLMKLSFKGTREEAIAFLKNMET